MRNKCRPFAALRHAADPSSEYPYGTSSLPYFFCWAMCPSRENILGISRSQTHDFAVVPVIALRVEIGICDFYTCLER
jgi:hypothetical protein